MQQILFSDSCSAAPHIHTAIQCPDKYVENLACAIFHFSTVHSVQYRTTLHCSRVIIQAGWQRSRKSSTSRVAMQCNNKWKQGGNAVPWRPVPVTPAAAVHRDSVWLRLTNDCLTLFRILGWNSNWLFSSPPVSYQFSLICRRGFRGFFTAHIL